MEALDCIADMDCDTEDSTLPVGDDNLLGNIVSEVKEEVSDEGDHEKQDPQLQKTGVYLSMVVRYD